MSVILLKSHMLNKIRNKHVEEDGGWWLTVDDGRYISIGKDIGSPVDVAHSSMH